MSAPGLFAAVLVAAFSTTSAHAQIAAPNDIALGESLYNGVGCWQCHGYQGQGGAGPRVGPQPLPWPVFKDYVRSPTRSMPPYSERVLTDEQLQHIYAFLQSRSPPNPATRTIGESLRPSGND